MRNPSYFKSLELDREFSWTWSALERGVAEGVAPGMVAGFYLQSKPDQYWVGAIGSRRLEPSALPMLKETPFDLASVSKVFATAVLAALLVSRRWLGWETRVQSVFADFPFKEIKVRHLLSHTAGYPAWAPLWQELRTSFNPTPLYKIPVSIRQSAMRELVFSKQIEVRPGQRALYSDFSALVMGFVLEEILKMPLDCAVKKWVWGPLGLDTAFFARVTTDPLTGRLEEVAATERCSWRGEVLQGQVHDDNCWAMGGYGGHAGAFGTAKDVLQFSRGLLNGFLELQVLERMWTRAPEPPGCERTLGWDTPSGEDPSASKSFSAHSVGHLGFTGTSLWIDLDAGLAVTLLTNRVHPSRENAKIKAFRPIFHRAIREDLSQMGWVRSRNGI